MFLQRCGIHGWVYIRINYYTTKCQAPVSWRWGSFLHYCTHREENKYQRMMWGKLNFCCDCVSDRKFLFHYVVQGSNTSDEQPEEPVLSNIKHDIQFSISKAYEKNIHTLESREYELFLLQHPLLIAWKQWSQQEMVFTIHFASVMSNF